MDTSEQNGVAMDTTERNGSTNANESHDDVSDSHDDNTVEEFSSRIEALKDSQRVKDSQKHAKKFTGKADLNTAKKRWEAVDGDNLHETIHIVNMTDKNKLVAYEAYKGDVVRISGMVYDVIVRGVRNEKLHWDSGRKTLYLDDFDPTLWNGTNPRLQLGFCPLEYLLKLQNDDQYRSVYDIDEAITILKAMAFFEMVVTGSLYESCEKVILKKLDKRTCISILLKLDDVQKNIKAESSTNCIYCGTLKPLFNACYNIARWHFKNILSSANEEIYELTPEMIKEIAKHDQLNVDNEDQVRAALEIYDGVRKDTLSTRDVDLEDLIKTCVRIDNKPNEIRDILKECGLEPELDKALTNDKPRVKSEHIIILGGEKLEKGVRVAINDVQYFDEAASKFQLLTRIPGKETKSGKANDAALIGFSACVIDTDIYITCGSYTFSDDWNLDMHIYSPLKNHWSKSHLGIMRRNHGSCSDGEHIFIIGGFERYRQRTATIVAHRLQGPYLTGPAVEKCEIPDLPEAIVNPSAFFSNNALYVVDAQTIYRYSMDLKQWTKIRPKHLGAQDVMDSVAVTPVPLPGHNTGLAQIAVVGPVQSEASGKCQLHPVCTHVVEGWRQGFVYRYYNDNSQLASIGMDVYRTSSGNMDDAKKKKKADEPFLVNIRKSVLHKGDETVLCGPEKISNILNSHVTVVAPLLFP